MSRNFSQAAAAWASDRLQLEADGIYFPSYVMGYVPDGWGSNLQVALDAQPSLTTDPNSAVPAMLTTLIDPTIIEIIYAPNKAAQIVTEVRKGTWLDETAMFPVVEYTGEVTSYGDFANSGRTGVNTNWPQRQSYYFQTIKEYGEKEIERAGLSRVNWVSSLDRAATIIMNKYSNLTYFFGVQGLQNYGLLNDPNLTAALTPVTKAAGNAGRWMFNGALNATANEIYLDIESLFIKLVAQTGGLVDRETAMTLALSPQSEAALTATNSFNVNVSDLLKKNFPNIRIISAVQYGALSTTNPQGVAAGEFAQLIANSIEGQDVAYCAYNEKQRAHPIIRDMSSFKQKVSAGTWGTIIRMPVGIASMVGL